MFCPIYFPIAMVCMKLGISIEYDCHIFSKYLVFQMKNLVFQIKSPLFRSKTLNYDRKNYGKRMSYIFELPTYNFKFKT